MTALINVNQNDNVRIHIDKKRLIWTPDESPINDPIKWWKFIWLTFQTLICFTLRLSRMNYISFLSVKGFELKYFDWMKVKPFHRKRNKVCWFKDWWEDPKWKNRLTEQGLTPLPSVMWISSSQQSTSKMIWSRRRRHPPCDMTSSQVIVISKRTKDKEVFSKCQKVKWSRLKSFCNAHEKLKIYLLYICTSNFVRSFVSRRRS